MKNIFFSLVAIIILSFSCFCKAQIAIISTIAGNGISAHSGDDGLATASEIITPNSGAFDSNGNYYFSERYGNRIRKISPSGIISTIAGNGTAGYLGDGGAATIGLLNNPLGIAIDHFGNLYIAEVNNNVIRKVVLSTGIISTYAGNGISLENGDGGLATAASIYAPEYICVDDTGNVYVSDLDNKIRKINAATEIITTIAGKGGITGYSGDGGPADSAQLFGPAGICTDTIGNVFIADYYNNRVRKVNAFTGIITTIAGNSLATYNGEGLTATSAQLSPYNVCFDSYGNLYVADEGNNRVRKIDTTDHIYTVAGNGTGAYSGDGILATVAEIFHPEGITFDSCGNLYIADQGNNRIRKVNFNPSCNLYPVDSASLNVASMAQAAINIFPNPATTSLTITASNKISQIFITNLIGQTVYNKACDIEKAEVNISGFPQGVYIVKVTDNKGQQTISKIVKQ